MKKRISRLKKERAEAGDLGTITSNHEIAEFLKGSTEKILPLFEPKEPRDFHTNCGRCGRSGFKLFAVRFRSIKLCGDCVFGSWKTDCSGRTTDGQEIVNGFAEGTRQFKLYFCFCCGKSFSMERMSCALVLCRKCLGELRAMNPTGSDRQILRIQSRISRFLRGRR